MVAATRLTWVCHAATQATRLAAFPADEPIEDKAIAEVRALADRLGRHDGVFAGPERRTLATAEALGLRASIEPALGDCDFGRWAGRALKELDDSEPAALAAWLSDPEASPHGGESLARLMQRVAGWLEGPARQKARVVAVSHPSVIRAAIVHALGAPAASFWRVDVAPLSLTRMTHDGRAWKLQSAR